MLYSYNPQSGKTIILEDTLLILSGCSLCPSAPVTGVGRDEGG